MASNATEQRYQLGLTIGHHGKAIPYGGNGEARSDGGANYGFRSLKGHPERLAEIPELQNDPSLQSMIQAINEPQTAFWSVGCDSGIYSAAAGQAMQGFVEFAINSQQVAADARTYFAIFFNFDRMLHGSDFGEPVAFNWELDSAYFADADVDGFTMTVWVRTSFYPSEDEAREAWGRSLCALTQFLSGVPSFDGTPIY